MKDESIESLKKVPFLGDIPLLDNAFKSQDKLLRKTELVIFLTPKIISGDVVMEEVEDMLLTMP